jgi:hypothetical protein
VAAVSNWLMALVLMTGPLAANAQQYTVTDLGTARLLLNALARIGLLRRHSLRTASGGPKVRDY